MTARPRLILHMGLPKTATTSLQFWADAQREALLERGIWYPVSAGQVPKHQVIVSYLQGKGDDLLEAFFDDLPAVPTVLVSAEGLAGHLPEVEQAPDRAQKFRDRLAAFDVTLALMVRDRSAWLRSYHQQKICNPPNDNPDLLFATTLTLDAFERHPRIAALLDTDGLLARARAAYGVDKAEVLTLENDWEAEFCQLLGAPDMTDSLRAAPRQNVGLGPVDTEFMRQANGSGMWKARNHLLAVLRHNLRKPCPPAQQRLLRPLVATLSGDAGPDYAARLEKLRGLVG